MAAIGQELSTVRASDRLSVGGEFSKTKKSGVQLVSSFWPVRYRTFLCLTNGPKKKPALEVSSRAGLTVLNCAVNWVQGLDLNQRPSGYEGDGSTEEDCGEKRQSCVVSCVGRRILGCR